jgi:hypothetical protein
MTVKALETWGERWRGGRVLFRTDNVTTAAIINKLDTSSPELEPLARAMAELARRFDVDVAARHIPGVKNVLSDRLSRWRGGPDSEDWQFRRDEYEYWRERLGPWQIDAFCDPVGNNAHEPWFWSAVDSALEHQWGANRIWANPPWSVLAAALRYAKKMACEQQTSCTMVVPFWPTHPFWKHTKGFRLVARYLAGEHLFTAPPREQGGARRSVGGTRWPTVLLHMDPPACAGQKGALPLLRGDARHDRLVALQMPPRLVPEQPRSEQALPGGPALRDSALLTGHIPNSVLNASTVHYQGSALNHPHAASPTALAPCEADAQSADALQWVQWWADAGSQRQNARDSSAPSGNGNNALLKRSEKEMLRSGSGDRRHGDDLLFPHQPTSNPQSLGLVPPQSSTTIGPLFLSRAKYARSRLYGTTAVQPAAGA